MEKLKLKALEHAYMVMDINRITWASAPKLSAVAMTQFELTQILSNSQQKRYWRKQFGGNQERDCEGFFTRSALLGRSPDAGTTACESIARSPSSLV